MSNIIQINNLNKSFGSVNAVQNLSFRVKKESWNHYFGIDWNLYSVKQIKKI